MRITVNWLHNNAGSNFNFYFPSTWFHSPLPLKPIISLYHKSYYAHDICLWPSSHDAQMICSSLMAQTFTLFWSLLTSPPLPIPQWFSSSLSAIWYIMTFLLIFIIVFLVLIFMVYNLKFLQTMLALLPKSVPSE